MGATWGREEEGWEGGGLYGQQLHRDDCTLKLTSEIGPVASAMPTPSSYDGTADAATTAATPAHMTIDAHMIIPQLERGGLELTQDRSVTQLVLSHAYRPFDLDLDLAAH